MNQNNDLDWIDILSCIIGVVLELGPLALCLAWFLWLVLFSGEAIPIWDGH